VREMPEGYGVIEFIIILYIRTCWRVTTEWMMVLKIHQKAEVEQQVVLVEMNTGGSAGTTAPMRC
jgi:hypothetical protein